MQVHAGNYIPAFPLGAISKHVQYIIHVLIPSFKIFLLQPHSIAWLDLPGLICSVLILNLNLVWAHSLTIVQWTTVHFFYTVISESARKIIEAKLQHYRGHTNFDGYNFKVFSHMFHYDSLPLAT